MVNNKINLQAQGFKVTTGDSVLTLGNQSANFNTDAMTIRATSATFAGPTVDIKKGSTSVKAMSKEGVSITGTDVTVETTGDLTVNSQRSASVTTKEIDITSDGDLQVGASVFSSKGDHVVMADSASIAAGSSKLTLAEASAMLKSGTVTVTATTGASVKSSSVTVGNKDNSIVVDSNGAQVKAKRITFKSRGKTITLDDLMAKLDTLQGKVSNLESDLSDTDAAVSTSISTSGSNIQSLANDGTTLSSLISTQNSNLNAAAISLATDLEETETGLASALETTADSLDTYINDMDDNLRAAGHSRKAVSTAVSAARSTLETRLADVDNTLHADIDAGSPVALSTSVSNAMSTLAKAVTDTQSTLVARLSTSTKDVNALNPKISAAHAKLSAAKNSLQAADLSLTARLTKSKAAISKLNADMRTMKTSASSATRVIPAISNAAHGAGSLVTSLSKPMKQMASDVGVLKDYVIEEVGAFKAIGTLAPLKRDSFDYYGGACDVFDDVVACGNQAQRTVDLFVIDAAKQKATRTANVVAPTAAKSTTTSRFGFAVALTKNWLVVGAWYDTPEANSRLIGAGRVYVYRRAAAKGTVTTSVYQLKHDKPASHDNCGQAVAASDEFVVFACPREESKTSTWSHGSLVIHRWDAKTLKFVHVTTTVHSTAASYQDLGRSYDYYTPQGVTFNKELAVVGNMNADVRSTNYGHFLVFARDGSKFNEVQVGYVGATQRWANCGSAVVFRGDYLAVACARRNVGTQTYAGEVTIYKYNAAKRKKDPFSSVQTITEPTPTSYRYFGNLVTMNEDGSRMAIRSNTNSGTIYYYKLVNGKFVADGVVSVSSESNFGRGYIYPGSSYSLIGNVYARVGSDNSAGKLDMMGATFPEVV
eukprot:TRINITY_DN9014_c0_g1_i1.p1 TRINITY_DN9014_c0_g1~~TRINITY_DN9014_c0_g1_i1.p1  ORF type:complete len:915 (+),score=266.04 TRINITY_DN9014_c0_g1_i1:103-2745(+)